MPPFLGRKFKPLFAEAIEILKSDQARTLKMKDERRVQRASSHPCIFHDAHYIDKFQGTPRTRYGISKEEAMAFA